MAAITIYHYVNRFHMEIGHINLCLWWCWMNEYILPFELCGTRCLNKTWKYTYTLYHFYQHYVDAGSRNAHSWKIKFGYSKWPVPWVHMLRQHKEPEDQQLLNWPKYMHRHSGFKYWEVLLNVGMSLAKWVRHIIFPFHRLFQWRRSPKIHHPTLTVLEQDSFLKSQVYLESYYPWCLFCRLYMAIGN